MNITFLHDEPEIYPKQGGGKERCILNLAEGLSEFEEVKRLLKQYDPDVWAKKYIKIYKS